MSQIHFDGPVDVDLSLAMALWNAMPDISKSGVAQMFFSRFVTAPISDKAIEAGARVFFEREKLNQAGAKALREGVAEKCRSLGEKSINPQMVLAVVEDETRKASAAVAQARLAELLSAIPIEAMVAAATPVIAELVKGCAHHYFTKTAAGQSWLLALVQKVCEEEQESLQMTIAASAGVIAEPMARRAVAGVRSARRSKPVPNNGELDIAPVM